MFDNLLKYYPLGNPTEIFYKNSCLSTDSCVTDYKCIQSGKTIFHYGNDNFQINSVPLSEF